MESINRAKFDNVSNFDLLVNKVQEKLHGKKFLLVLDDLWNENIQQWERLKSMLLVGAQGSKILITTRNMHVADVVKGSIRPCQLGKLQENECWSIIEKKAFSPGGAVKTTNMTNIGREISKKCSGLPLAAKFLGSQMHLKNKESDWLSIKEMEIWNTQQGQSEIAPILKLSYDNLSPHLKQCFSYCSIFPKGWEIKRETVIHLWMAEGFLEPSSNISGNKQSIEDIGEEYFDSLVWSSFLDAEKRNDLDDIITCKMHDLVHDLARDVVGNRECATFRISELENISHVRRLQLISDDDLSTTRPKALGKLKKLRTIIVLEPNYGLKDYSFSSNKKLRVLYFGRIAGGCTRICYPAANKLKHLRYFYLSDLNLKGMGHNNHISKLYNLQTLVLKGCGFVQKFLENIGSLKNLRSLDISFTDIKELPNSVTSLCNLRKLDLSHCKNLTIFPNSVTGLKYLISLDMSFTPILQLPAFIINLGNLQTFDANNCKKLKSLPEYVAGLANLRIFNFKNCPLLEAIPKDFGALTQLRYLNFEGTEIKVLPESCTNLYNLEFLDLFRCELPKDVTNWTKLRKFCYFRPRNQIILGVGKLVCLQMLVYSMREKLINRPQCGIEELRNLNLLEVLSIVNLENVKYPVDAESTDLKGKHNLRELVLGWGEIEELGIERWDEKSCNFQVFQALQPAAGLRYLNIQNFMGWDLPSWMCESCLPELECLILINFRGIQQLPASIAHLPRLKRLDLIAMSLKGLDVSGFPPSLIELNHTDMFNLEELSYSDPSCLQTMSINGCKSLAEIPSFPFLMKLLLHETDHKLVCSIMRSQTSLKELWLENIEELIYFPISTCNLQLLRIKECNQFEGFHVNDDENENVVALYGPELYGGSIQDLGFYDCPVLKFLPDLRGSTSLKKLAIWNCPKVKESLTYDLKSLSFLKILVADFIQRDDRRGDPSTPEDLINLLW